MARKRINPTWINEMRENLNRFKHHNFPFEPVIISYNQAAKWLVAEMAVRGLTPKVENLGVGVKRISIKGTCCPTCGRAS